LAKESVEELFKNAENYINLQIAPNEEEKYNIHVVSKTDD